jgi:2-polyprenyl-6-methoxyphenol hydroxylase-like FAD-dependent oxidoreductase
MTRAIVVGAGIGGLATSIALRPTGVEAVVLERASDLAKVELGAGITLWSNAMLVLDRLGVGQAVREKGAILNHFEQRNHRGRLLSRWPLDEMARRLGAPVCGINRTDLHAALVAAAAGDTVTPASEVVSFEQSNGSVRATISDGRVESADTLIGADGIDSVIRAQLLGRQAPRHSGLIMWRANLPDGVIKPPVDFIAWWGSGAKFVIFRSGPQRISWEGIVTSPPGGQDPAGQRRQAIHQRFADFPRAVHEIIEATDEGAIFRTDVCDRLPDKQWGRGRVTLIGDAAHPMTFAVGQGAAQALEDAAAIADALANNSNDLDAALRAYERRRMPRSAHFQTMAWRLARAGALQSSSSQAARNTAFRLSSPIAWRMQVKDMTIPSPGP